MFSRLREHLGTGGLIVAIVALVAALAGGAYAASGGLSSKQKKEVKAIAKSFQGTGPQGLKGDAGAAGPQGPKGDSGSQGIPGTNGTNGVAGPTGPAGTNGTNGVAGPTGPAGTNGTNGVAGPTGPVGPSCNGSGECNLPSGATETGVWSIAGEVLNAGVPGPSAFISYPFHLTFTPTVKYVKVSSSETVGAVAGCPGTRAAPKAEAGNLCIYSSGGGVKEPPLFSGAAAIDLKSGALFTFQYATGETEAVMFGTWAVKAP
jgi:collagen triple helix repeat protein